MQGWANLDRSDQCSFWLPEELLGAEMIVKQAMDGTQAVNNVLATVPHDVEAPITKRLRAICGRAPFI
jgi:hypothetical protein